ncbi:receptor-type tyrosine-protein phosphatase alpha-like [Crassostrea virginica]
MHFNYVQICLMGISSVLTYDDLSYKNNASQSKTYAGKGYGAGNAVDKNTTTCMRTDHIGQNSPDKTVWWKVDLGGVYNIYSVNILFKNYDGFEMRQRGRFAGFSLYISNTGNRTSSSLCYKDGPSLPPLNFTTTCTRSGRYVIFYNERLDGATYPTGYEVASLVYTELCEVIVYGCKKNGVYGNECNISCPDNCTNNNCHIQNGTCFSCAPGWRGPRCSSECGNGTYGNNCSHNCSGHCLNDYPCNKQTGNCDSGCTPGYKKNNCSEECPRESFGDRCEKKCSKRCFNNQTCNHIAGVCPDGCTDGDRWENCNQTCKDGFFGANCSQVCSENCTKCGNTDGTCVFPVGGSTSNVEDMQHSDRAVDPSIIGGSVGGCLAFIVGVAVAVFVVWYRKKRIVKSTRESLVVFDRTELTLETHPQERRDKIRNDQQISNRKNPTLNKNISVKNIRAQIENMSFDENAGFKSEYNDIPRGELHPCSVAKQAENAARNRYTTIFPYDHSRVILKTEQNANDYINANYIEDTQETRLYIATQGPKPKTIPVFWTMIWQEEITIIVCLTNLKEGVKNKCTQYWPNINDKLQAGVITIRNVEEKMYAENTIRKFKIYHNENEQDRPVTMYHYTTWADHGVADPLSLVVFHRQVMKNTIHSTGKYTLVHCSAGVGRTGTYMALDALYREGQNTGKINVPMYVNTMRKDRMNMIQGEDQYRVLYLALMEAFCGPPKAETKETFLSNYNGKTSFHKNGDVSQTVNLATEFQELLSLMKAYSQKDYVSGRVHLSANYTKSVLPLEEYVCDLSYVEGRNTYYNAVLLRTFLENDSMISAQYPLPEYTEDFLRLIRDFNARIVVFLCAIKDTKSSTRWFPKKGNNIHVGNFTMKHLSSTSSPHVTKTKLVLQNKGSNDIGITVLECPSWNSEQLTVDKRVLLDVINEVKTEKTYQEGRIIILSSDGATRCGPFCAVYNALEQITTDGEVDLFTIARQLKVRRPEFLSTLAEYQLCYDTVAEYLLNDSVYGNC